MSSPETICAEYNLRFCERLESHGSAWAYKAVNAAGEIVAIKCRGQEDVYTAGEAAALRVWAGERGSAQLLAQPEKHVLIIRWIEGPIATALPRGGREGSHTVGQVLRELHRPATNVQGLSSLRGVVGASLEANIVNGELPPYFQRIAWNSLERLRSSHDVVVAHGDVGPHNTIVTPKGPVMIDPWGLVVPAAWDLASWAAFSGWADAEVALREVVAGYGSEPELLEDAFCAQVASRLAYRLRRGRPVGNLPELAQQIANKTRST